MFETNRGPAERGAWHPVYRRQPGVLPAILAFCRVQKSPGFSCFVLVVVFLGGLEQDHLHF